MQGNFFFYNPTKIYFGPDSLNALNAELSNYGQRILLVYGGGSIKKIGLYDEVIKILSNANKSIFELPGVMPNPTLNKLYEGLELARKIQPDLILAVGGGSVIDYAKALSASIYEKDDPWQKFYVRYEEPNTKITPIGAILTMSGTGSEMNGGAVITNEETKEKHGHVFGAELYPRFAILNPLYTMSVPFYQMVAGIYDAFNHLLEQYFSGEDNNNVSDDITLGLLRSIKNNGLLAVKNPQDYIARSNIMWASTLALNTLVGKGKKQDWLVHALGHAISARTNATHGMTLSAISLPYYRHLLKYDVPRFANFAKYVFDIDDSNYSEKERALAGLVAFKEWLVDMHLVTSISALGINDDMIDEIARECDGKNGYCQFSVDELKEILREAL